MREQPRIPEENLRVCLQDQYDLIPVTLDFLPLGLDNKCWGVSCGERAWTLPICSKSRPDLSTNHSCLVPCYLSDQGIASVVAPLPTKRHILWTRVGAWTVIVYPFLEGDTSWEGMTDEQWKEVGTIFKRIHQVIPPPEGFESLRKETFDPTEYARWVHAFETQQARSEGGSISEHALRSSWMAHQPTIHTGGGLSGKAGRCPPRRSGPYVICHADLHPGNLIT